MRPVCGWPRFYRNGDKMMVVSVQTQPMFTPGKAQLLFQVPYGVMDSVRPNFDVAPDGQRFLMIKDAESESARRKSMWC